MATLIMLALMFAAVYFLMIRPQQKRGRRIAEMQSSLGIGDEVVTVGGLYGTIHSIDDDTVLLEIAPDVVTRYARASISRVTESAASDEDSAEEVEEEEEVESAVMEADAETSDGTADEGNGDDVTRISKTIVKPS